MGSEIVSLPIFDSRMSYYLLNVLLQIMEGIINFEFCL
jgi:hypothetical protein